MPTKALPKEKLDWFRLNTRVATDYKDCSYCNKVQTKGRDGFGDGQCDACLIKIHDQLNAKPAPPKDARYKELLAQAQGAMR